MKNGSGTRTSLRRVFILYGKRSSPRSDSLATGYHGKLATTKEFAVDKTHVLDVQFLAISDRND